MFEFDPYSPETDADPFPSYARLRDEYPCFWSDHVNMWILSRYDDVSEALKTWQTYSSSKGNLIDELPDRAGSTLGSTDPPQHDRLRGLTRHAFQKKNVMAAVEKARGIAETAAARCADAGEFDFVNDFSSQITVGTLFHALGLPDEDHEEVRGNVMLSIQSDSETRQKTEKHIQGFRNLVAYVRAQVADRRKAPADDLISALITAEEDGDQLSEPEIVMTTATFIMAGVESLSSFMSMLALNLHDFPDARRRIVADPKLMDPAIEESLRYNTSAQRFRRVLRTDIELHGQTMRAGDFVCLCYGSANRDGRKYRNPDVYDLERRPRGHLGFGGGEHICIGAMLARLVTAKAMGIYLEHLPEYHLTVERLDWTPSSTFRSPLALPFQAA